MVKLQIDFPAGAYSSNKENIKKVFTLLEYKYNGGHKQGNVLICSWRKNKEENIKGIFTGSGKACKFIITCNDNEVDIFKAFTKPYNAIIKGADDSIKEDLLSVANAKVKQWFTIVPQEKGEPDFFYAKRKEKMMESFKWFVQQEYGRLKDAN